MKTYNPLRCLRHSLLIAIAVAGAAFQSVRADYTSTVLADNPIGFWPLNLADANGANGIATDLSGNNNNGSYVNIYAGYNNVFGPSAYITNGISFDGLTTYVDLSTGNNPALLNFGGQITMEAWVQSATLEGTGYIIGKGYDPNYNADEISLRCAGSYIFQGGIYDATVGDVRASAGDVTTNWVYLVCTCDGARWNLYCNGAIVAETTSTNAALDFPTPWAIGDGTASANNRIFEGNLSQVALYTNALTPAQVLTHYFVGLYGTTNLPPVIVQQPVPQLASPGATVSFTVQTESLLPVTNQWFFNGAALANQTNATLVLNNIQTANAGSYSVLAGNSAGTTNSAVVRLSVETPGAYGFSPVPVASSSYNESMIMAKGDLVPATTATLDQGTENYQTTWFQQGYYLADPTVGLPAPGATLSYTSNSVEYTYSMAPSYTNDDAILINSTVSSAALTPTMPAAYSSLSFLGSAGFGPATNNYAVYHSDGTIETGKIVAPDWFSGNGSIALGVGGRVDAAARSFGYWGAGGLPYIYDVNISLSDTTSPVTRIVLTSASGGNTCWLALSGSTGGNYSPIAFTGYNEGMIVPANAQQFVGGSYTTASMDNGTANTGTSWYELGYSTTPYFAAGSGVPGAGSWITTTNKIIYLMAPSYTNNDVAYVDASTSDTITMATPVNVWGLSFLCSAGHGPIVVDYQVNHADSTAETGTLTALDWFNTTAVAWTALGRVDVGNDGGNSGSIQTFGNVPVMHWLNIGVTNINSPVTSINLTWASGAGNYSGGNAEIFAVSGAYTNQQDIISGIFRNSNGSPQGSGSATLTFKGIPGYQYMLQFTTNVAPPVVWQSVTTNTAGINGLCQFTDTGATNHPAAFYRTLFLP
ncbi:MAG TPA: LamG-like jellyroll fold domain-containing protein [Alphaproteobacteria bacterium]|nr:LamG-like jellyroll fold domain-containing protein [Alphaproteobacteria bacterium]